MKAHKNYIILLTQHNFQMNLSKSRWSGVVAQPLEIPPSLQVMDLYSQQVKCIHFITRIKQMLKDGMQ
jgi:hypothetical protein